MTSFLHYLPPVFPGFFGLGMCAIAKKLCLWTFPVITFGLLKCFFKMTPSLIVEMSLFHICDHALHRKFNLITSNCPLTAFSTSDVVILLLKETSDISQIKTTNKYLFCYVHYFHNYFPLQL